MKLKYGWTLLTFVFFNCGVVEAKTDTNTPVFEQKLIANEKILIEMIEQKGISTKSSVVRHLLSAFSMEKIDYNYYREYLWVLYEIGRGTPKCEIHNGLIREPLIVEILVSALFDNNKDLREFASNLLINSTEWRLLPPFKSDIQKALAKHYIPDPVKLLCLLNLTDSEKRHWLKSEKTHTLAQRAALGDVKSEDSLITLFKKAKTWGQLSNGAEDLAFVGSKKCRIALVKGLENDLFVEQPGSVITHYGIVVVINELRRLHPDEPLLTNEFRSVEEPIYAKSGILEDLKVKDYLTRLAKWAESTYGVKLNIPRENSFIRTKSNPSGILIIPLPPGGR
ncbi:MAG: hypothetical protein LBI42_15815 [Chitinispirillales bacterium]|jgi:hypothetical protein|nr:hypothetical protein [Chitinispirillales bacterium]